MIAIWRNPKKRIWYDFFTRKHPEWEGDFADFVADAIEYFSRGSAMNLYLGGIGLVEY